MDISQNVPQSSIIGAKTQMGNESSTDKKSMASGAHHCRACNSGLLEAAIGTYTICPVCGSANYSSDKSAVEDNKKYFNSIYAKIKPDILSQRKKKFDKYNRFNSRMHFRETGKFNDILEIISSTILKAEKTLEVGFGHGDELAKYIKAGADIYGIDLSEVAVDNFQRNYPDYKSRVSCAVTCDFFVDVIYSNALLEHLDTPSEFLANAFAMLKPGGLLITRLPMITCKMKDKWDMDFDINFWKPCHRVLYTLNGLNILFEKHGFKILDFASLNYYGYKVMSNMMKLGYDDIVYIRNPYFQIKGLDSELTFKWILFKSLFNKTICSDTAIIAAKIK